MTSGLGLFRHSLTSLQPSPFTSPTPLIWSRLESAPPGASKVQDEVRLRPSEVPRNMEVGADPPAPMPNSARPSLSKSPSDRTGWPSIVPGFSPTTDQTGLVEKTPFVPRKSWTRPRFVTVTPVL